MFNFDISFFDLPLRSLPTELQKYMNLQEAQEILDSLSSGEEVDPSLIERAKTVNYAARLFNSDEEAINHFNDLRAVAILAHGISKCLDETKILKQRSDNSPAEKNTWINVYNMFEFMDESYSVKSLNRRVDPRINPPLRRGHVDLYAQHIFNTFREVGILLEELHELKEYIVGPKGYLFHYYDANLKYDSEKNKLFFKTMWRSRYEFDLETNIQTLTPYELESKIRSILKVEPSKKRIVENPQVK